MKLKVAGKTDKGRVRANNEDNFTIDEGIKLVVVADGAGGQATGEVASGIAVEVIREQLRRMIFEHHPEVFLKEEEKKLSSAARKLISSIQFANRVVYEASQKYPQNYGMATTCVATLIGEVWGECGGEIGDNNFVYCNVGDSRLYLIRDGNLKLLTTDHSLVAKQLQKRADN
ncbi:MAG: protein phosphatase 2C domain-containing protein [Elusimicrobiota bacterium]|nr:protein phosphatase 2C domain-containing protein [Elusimicrobiota bacterium]